MANKNLFKGTGAGRGNVTLVPTDTTNNAGGGAYKFSAEHELAQLVCTGMLGDTFYVSAKDQLARVLDLASKVSPEYLAQLAIYSREQGKMKDMPALACAMLFTNYAPGAADYLKKIFLRVINNGRMLRNFVQMVRSGQLGRKSLGTLGKKLVQAYFDSKSCEALFSDTVGNDPSLADVIKLAHVRPTTPEREALYRYIVGKDLTDAQKAALPKLVKDFEAFKAGKNGDRNVPKVPFQMLTALDLTTDEWTTLALNGNWQFVRMNLNTFARHGVFKNKEVTAQIADKLRDAESIAKAKVFPYQLLMAYMATEGNDIPVEIRNALQDAMEVATKNVQKFDVDGVEIYPDTSGSMGSPVSGYREGATSKASCLDVASLISSCILRANPNSHVVPFAHGTYKIQLNARDSIMTNSDKLRKCGGGGTNCSAPLREANEKKVMADLVVYVSDNESWVDAKNPGGGSWYGHGATATMDEWKKFKARNPKAKMVNINLTPGGSTQASNDKDILNIGGFSDSIFEIINSFVSGNKAQWVDVIKTVVL